MATPVVLVLCSGGVVSFDDLVAPSAAIIEAFNPVDQGTQALADSIFGGENRWGKLPVTIYPAGYTKALDAAGAGIADYSFSKGPGRGYRCVPPPDCTHPTLPSYRERQRPV